MPFGHKAGLPPSKKYLLMRQPLFLNGKELTFMQRLRLFFVYRETGYMLIKIRHAGISVWRISYGFYSYPGPIGIYTWSSGDFGAAFVVSGTVSCVVSA